jgi:PilZ domain
VRDRRLHERTATGFQVNVTLCSNPELSGAGETVDISASGLAVCLPFELAPGSLVQVHIADSVLQGFVIHSREWPASASPSFARNKIWTESSWAAEAPPERPLFHTGIDLVEASIGTSGLSQLLEATLADKLPELRVTNSVFA